MSNENNVTKEITEKKAKNSIRLPLIISGIAVALGFTLCIILPFL